MCPYWGGDGAVCLCALFDLDPCALFDLDPPSESTEDEDAE